jgi:transcriptional regulator
VYIKERHRPSTQSDIRDLIRRYPLATIVCRDAHGLTASHLPLILDAARGRYGTLIGHMARAKAHHEALRTDPSVLAVFAGPCS